MSYVKIRREEQYIHMPYGQYSFNWYHFMKEGPVIGPFKSLFTKGTDLL